ncbi:MAG: class II fumarate hydratase [Desulfomonilaceae bacterium]
MNIEPKQGHRIESDSIGSIEVPDNVYWGAQTQRSLHFFHIGSEKMPHDVIRAIALIKKCAAIVNRDLGLITGEQSSLIIRCAEEILEGKLVDQFPLSVWQTGSGTQTNMNVNEVIANKASELSGEPKGSKKPLHPNDHINLSQSSNDVFPTAMHVAAALKIVHELIPAITLARDALNNKAEEFNTIVKIGRTHLQDAVPLTLGQEFSGYVAQLDIALKAIENSLTGLYELAIGGTAVGTGLNAPLNFDVLMAKRIHEATGLPFVAAPNKFAALAGHEPCVVTSGALKTLGCALMKIANDIRWLGSGPRCGIGELILPANEPGSSIMPGKVNPTQCEALTMVAIQVMGYDSALSFACSQGNFELNVFKPLIIFNLMQSVTLLAEGSRSFTANLLNGLKPNLKNITEHVNQSLMLVTALSPKIGYDNAAKVAKHALENGLSLREAASELGFVTFEEYDLLVDPTRMISPHK